MSRELEKVNERILRLKTLLNQKSNGMKNGSEKTLRELTELYKKRKELEG